MNLRSRINAFSNLGKELLESKEVHGAIVKAKVLNPWFTKSNVELAIDAIARDMLDISELEKWMSKYDLQNIITEDKSVALVLAGNIPAVGFHDILCVLISGLKVKIKLSSKDAVIIPFILDKLIKIEPAFSARIEYVERLKNFDAVIATGSNNTAIHFEHYFAKYPHIIRKNRKSIAVITKDSTDSDIRLLGDDILRYFGLGCRNVSKLYIEEGVDLTKLMELWHENKEINLHNKYKNNYDYNYTLLLMNGADFLMNGALLLVAEPTLHSRIATVNYEIFSNWEQLESELNEASEDIQCIVSQKQFSNLESINPGESQRPGLTDYADNLDTIEFLLSL